MPDEPPADTETPRHPARPKGARRQPDRTVVVSHEIRNPLGVVTALTELLLARDLPVAERHIVELIRLAGHHLAAVTEDLVAEASMGAEAYRVVSAPFAPADTLRAIAALYAPLTAGTAKTIDVEIDPGVPAALVSDESRIRQILFNLVSNAAKCTAEGRIVLRLSADADGVHFQVQDDGPGIEDGFTPKPFDGRSDSKAPGSGLGLWISGRIAAALKGELRLTRRVEGGTLAVLTVPTTGQAVLPAAEGPEAADATPAAAMEAEVVDRRPAEAPRRRRRRSDGRAPGEDRPSGVQRVLVVDDSPVSRMLLDTILASFGLTVETATNGHDALATTHVFKPDVILMDWTLTDETGADVVRRLQAGCDRLPPVIGVSAAERPETLDGFAAWLTKPFTPRELYRAIERAVYGDSAAEHTRS